MARWIIPIVVIVGVVFADQILHVLMWMQRLLVEIVSMP